MDDQYLDAFIRESEEEITKLNNSLLALESDPGDREAMDQIFRTAHTLKGNFGAMGFEDASNLAHAIEDLLDEMREGEMEVTPDVMDLIFAGVDGIEAIVGVFEEAAATAIDTSETVDQLRTVLEEGTGADGAAVSDEPEADDAPSHDDVGIDADDVDGRVVHAAVDIGDSNMPGVDAMFVMEAVEEVFDLLEAVPDRADIEDGNYDETFGLLIDADDLGRVDAELDAIRRGRKQANEERTRPWTAVKHDLEIEQ